MSSILAFRKASDSAEAFSELDKLSKDSPEDFEIGSAVSQYYSQVPLINFLENMDYICIEDFLNKDSSLRRLLQTQS